LGKQKKETRPRGETRIQISYRAAIPYLIGFLL
jgi:hypothetical protein